MTAPEHDEPTPPNLLPAPSQPGRNGGKLRVGNPGNRGGRGRTARRTIIRASKDLDRELARLKRMAESVRTVHATCPNCQHAFDFDPKEVTGRMDARDRIAYARLLADCEGERDGRRRTAREHRGGDWHARRGDGQRNGRHRRRRTRGRYAARAAADRTGRSGNRRWGPPNGPASTWFLSTRDSARS